MAVYQRFPQDLRVVAKMTAKRFEMACADTDMADFVVKDSFEDSFAAFVSRSPDPYDRAGGNVQAPCFQDHWHHGEAGGDVMAGLAGRIPQSRMRGQCSVSAAERAQMAVQQGEVNGFIRCNGEEVAEERRPHIGAEASRHVQREVDRGELDVGKCMEEGNPPPQ